MHRTLLSTLFVRQAVAAVNPVTTGPNIIGSYGTLVDKKQCEGALVVGAPEVHQETMDGCALICNCINGCAGVNFNIGVGQKNAFTGDATVFSTAGGSCSFAQTCSSPADVSEGSELVLPRNSVVSTSDTLLDCTLATKPAEANGYKRIGNGGTGPLKCTGFEVSTDANGDWYQEQLGVAPSAQTCADKCDTTQDCVGFVYYVSANRCTFHKKLCDTLIKGTEHEDYYVRVTPWAPTPVPTPVAPTPTPTPTPVAATPTPTPTPSSSPTPTPTPTPSPAPTPSPPASTPKVVIKMTVANVNYDTLVADSSAKMAFEDSVATEVAAKAGSAITKDHVDVMLSKGSVKVEATVTPPEGTTLASVKSTLDDAKSALSSAVVSGIQAISGIGAFTTGTVAVSGLTFEEETPQSSSADAGTAAAPGLLVASALLFSVL